MSKFTDFSESLRGKKVAVIGAGVSNIPLFEYLHKHNAVISLFDKKKELSEEVNEIIEKYNIMTSLGEKYLESLQGFDIIFRSPSMLPTNEYLVREKDRGALVTTEVEQVIKLAPCKVMGITGSKGKTTTTTITNMILKGMGCNTFVGGNIGIPLFTRLDEISKDDIIILELSSFQLMNMTVSPNVSIVTNISPDHLDVHKDYREYINAKKSIFTNQRKDDVVVLNYDDEIVREFNKDAKGIVRYFSGDKTFNNGYSLVDDKIVYIDNNGKMETVLDTKNINLKGRHNYLNICSALNASLEYVDNSKVEGILKEFNGVEHRLEFVRDIDGVKWYNDSASTTPDKAKAGISAFDKKITLIAGGYDKNLEYKPLADAIMEYVDTLILFGQTKDKILNEVNKLNNNGEVKVLIGSSLEEVVNLAKENTCEGGIVLFSPASASFDMFKNAYQRGDLFKEIVNKL